MKILLLLLLYLGYNKCNCESDNIGEFNLQENMYSLFSFISHLIKQFKLFNKDTIVKTLINFTDRYSQILFPPPTLPELPQDIWWGNDSQRGHDDTSIRPFYVQLNPERIKRLLDKLRYRENFTKPLTGAAFTYGTNTDFLNYFLDYWLNKYDFDARQKRMNTYPQFITNIQGLDLHYMHVKPKYTGKKVMPLLLIHGWPLTNLEFFYVIPKLTEPSKEQDFVFEVIAPSIPGHGYSQGTSKIGLSPYQIGIILKNLMKRLGHKKFYIHAGDIGQFIASDMITMYQKDILGFHTNLPYSFLPKTIIKYGLGSLHPLAVSQPKYINRLYPISSRLYYYMSKFGYFHIQGNHPDCIGVSLSDSPSGTASWILNAIAWSTNPLNVFYSDGKILDYFKIDDILDFLTIMWDAEYLITSIRLYAETTAVFQDPTILKLLVTPSNVPYAAIKFRHEIIYQPDNFLKDKYRNLLHSTTLDFGGHAASLENPNIIAEDIWKAINKMIKYHHNKSELNKIKSN